MFYAIVGM